MLKHLAKSIPACLTVSYFDGLVLTRSAFHHSVEYRYAMCFGTAHSIGTEKNKNHALQAIIERLYPERYQNLKPMTAMEVKQTKVIFMKIEDAVAKYRNGGVKDDEEDYDLPVFAGVIPIKTVLGVFKPCQHLAENIAEPSHYQYYKPDHLFEESLKETQKLYEKTIKSD